MQPQYIQIITATLFQIVCGNNWFLDIKASKSVLSMSCNTWVRPGVTADAAGYYIRAATTQGVSKHISSR